MKHRRNAIHKILLYTFGFTLVACSSDNPDPSPDKIDPKEIILTKVGSDLDRFTIDAKANTLEIYSSSTPEGILQTYSRDETLTGPKVKMEFTKTEFSQIRGNTNSGTFFGDLSAWQETSITISNPIIGQPVAQEIGGTTKALNVSYTKVYQPVYFTTSPSAEKALQTWKEITAYKGKWTLIKNQEFKINNKDWQIKP
ncbi:hypothetical protein [Emticicia fontis]